MVGICHVYSNFNTGQTPRLAASDLGLHSLPMSHKKDARLVWVISKGSLDKNHAKLNEEDFLWMSDKIKTFKRQVVTETLKDSNRKGINVLLCLSAPDFLKNSY